MGLTQTKLHHRVLQENWPSIQRRLQSEDGKKWVKQRNPCGDLPLHLACYGGQAPPIVIRALIAAHPEAVHHKNDVGFTPLDLARVNYRSGHPYREEVLEFLEVYSSEGAGVGDGNSNGPEDDRNDVDEGGDYDTPQIFTSSDSALHLQPNNTYQTSTICVICLENKADHVVIPCGHQCLCGDCAKKVVCSGTKHGNIDGNRKTPRCCPVGRCAITSIMKVSIE
mmetsp:Transcript_23995/g.51017  ORF Transcript_23995/g.51017 Transcript_23995/m.51017 type:complete len:224 (+) Transcript_23995:282-953(+)